MKNKITKPTILFIALNMVVNIVSAQWTQLGQNLNGENIGDRFGYSVSSNFDGSIVAIGAIQSTGYVRIFEYSVDTWIQLGNDINGEAPHDWFGYSVSLNAQGNIVAVGGFQNDGNGINAGHVRVFEYISGVWIQLGNDIEGGAGDKCGNSVSLNSNGSILAIGSFNNSNNGILSGQARIFEYTGANWVQIGNDINGEAADDRCGSSVSLNSEGGIVAVGARNNDGKGDNAGHVRIFEYTSGVWTQLGNDIDGVEAGDESGYSVGINSDGTIVAIGARYNDGNGIDSGHVRIFEYDGINWVQMGDNIDGEYSGDQSGHGICLNSDGTIVAIGARYNGGDGINSGHVRIFEYNGSNWVQIGADIDGETSGDGSGFSSDLNFDGSIVIIGAAWNSGNGNSSGHARIYECETLGIIECISQNEIVISPNPATNEIVVSLKNDGIIKEVNIYNQVGQKIIHSNMMSSAIDISMIDKGIYIIEVKARNSNYKDKFIKR